MTCPQIVAFLLVLMYLAVDLDDQPALGAVEVGDEETLPSLVLRSQWMLAVEFLAHKTPVTHGVPECDLARRLMFAQIAGCLLDEVELVAIHELTPSCSPSL